MKDALRIAVLALSAVAGVATVPSAVQAQVKIINAQLETRPAAGGLEAEYRAFLTAAGEPAWLGYAVPTTEGPHGMCCGDSWSDHGRMGCGRCALEAEHGTARNYTTPPAGAVALEGQREILVLLRVTNHRISKVRSFNPDCEVDAGGVHVLWLTGVKPAESVAVLSGMVTAAGAGEFEFREPANGALAAIAMTADPSADRALESFTATNRPEKLRSQAAFWLGSARREPGLRVLEKMARDDPSAKVRAQVAFAFSVSHEPAAMDDLIRVAHDDSSAHVRGQALFWLAQKAGQRAAGVIAEAIENDPDTEIKRSAVFALTQLPHDQGIPLLLQVARSNKNPAVRKQAFFWLGQSNDPRALAFFEEILSRR